MTSNEPAVSAPNGLNILAAMDEWRQAHPTATLAEIEAALDERLSVLRRQMLQDTLTKSAQLDWSAKPPHERPTCSTCGVPLQPRGKRPRHLRAAGGDSAFERTYGVCPVCKQGVFPPRR